MKKKILALTLVFAFVWGQVSVFAEIKQPKPSLTPLQERLNMMNDVRENEDVQQEDILPEGFDQALLDEINNNPIRAIEPEEDEFAEDEEQAEASESTTDGTFDIAPLEVMESELETLSSSGIPDNFRVEPVNSVYNVLNNNNDYVSQATGALTYEKNLLSLPGANGLDLNLSVRYNSDDAVISVNEFADTNEAVRKINFNSFAIGWSFGFPTIVKSNVKKNYGFEKQTHLRFPDGSAYKILNDNDNLTSDITLTLEFYKLSDMTLVRKADTKDYILTYSNGRIETFDGTYGNIKQIKDIFGNHIDFEYTELDYFRGSFVDYMFKPSSYSATINALTKITDSAGRIITIEYTMSSTAYGKEVNSIRVRMNGTTYATIELARVKSYCGNVDIVERIIDGEYKETKYEYAEKYTHIYNSDINTGNPTYSLNGSVYALERVSLPTGGHIDYEYEKARRTYSYFIPQVIIDDWYEVYKISKVSDSSGFYRTYEYENDRSGYPYSSLNVEPAMPDGWWWTGTATGYIKDKNMQYYCIMRQNGATTITTFDYMHNKIREETYTENESTNSYIVGKGVSTYQVMIGNYIYHMGNTSYGYSSTKSYLYKQHISTGEVVILKPYSTAIPTNAQIKSYNGRIYMFYRTGANTVANPYKLIAKAYNPATEIWTDEGEHTFPANSIEGTRLTLSNMYYSNNVFYSYAQQRNTFGDSYLYHAIYNPSTASWTVNSTVVYIQDGYPILDVCAIGNKIYYKMRRSIIEYDLSANQTVVKTISALPESSLHTGFSISNKTFIIDSGNIKEFNFSTATISNTYTYPSLNYAGYGSFRTVFSAHKGSDGKIYFIANTNLADGTRPIYRFDTNDSTAFTLITNRRLINNSLTSVLMGNNCAYLVSDGVEKINLNTQSPTAASVLINYEYNNLNQLVSNTVTRMSGGNSQDGGTVSWTYVNGKSILTSQTDILGNRTEYEYINSPLYIPTKITTYANRDVSEQVVTTNVLSDDKTKIIQSSTAYSDRTIKTEYAYTHPTRPGNVTGETVSEIKDGNITVVRSSTQSYDPTGTLLASVTSKDIITNNVNFL